MNALQRVATVIGYEWRKALARKKFIALIVLVFAFQIIILIVFTHIFNNPQDNYFQLERAIEQTKRLMWIVEVLAPQGFFTSLVAIMIVSGFMSEEPKKAKANISEPITEIERLTGRYLAGLSLLSFATALTTMFGAILAVAFFSPQENLQYIPHIYLAIVYSNLVFLSLAFMLSEIFRRTKLVIWSAVGVVVASLTIGGFLYAAYRYTEDLLYLEVSKWLPSWSVLNFPSFLMGKLLNWNYSNFPYMMGEWLDAPSVMFAGLEHEDLLLASSIIATYTIIFTTVFIVVAIIRLVRSSVKNGEDLTIRKVPNY